MAVGEPDSKLLNSAPVSGGCAFKLLNSAGGCAANPYSLQSAALRLCEFLSFPELSPHHNSFKLFKVSFAFVLFEPEYADRQSLR